MTTAPSTPQTGFQPSQNFSPATSVAGGGSVQSLVGFISSFIGATSLLANLPFIIALIKYEEILRFARYGLPFAGHYGNPASYGGFFPPASILIGFSLVILVCGVLGVIFCSIGRNKALLLGSPRGLATAGLWIGLATLSVFIILAIITGIEFQVE